MTNGDIPDHAVTASSTWTTLSPSWGRLYWTKHGTSNAWIVASNDVNQWLQIDLSRLQDVTAIATQGRHGNRFLHWVISYWFSYSNDGATWNEYKENQARKTFTGNSDSETVVRHLLTPVIYARFVRFHPITWNGHISMRVEVYSYGRDITVAMTTLLSANHILMVSSAPLRENLFLLIKMAAKTTLKDNCDDLFDEIPYFDINLLPQIEGEEIKQDAGRFLNVTDSDVDKLIEGEENKITKKKTHYDLKLVKKFLEEERREDREIEKIPPHELNAYLNQFIVAARTKTGEEYEPTSLRGILSSVERHLKALL
ncbi:hypothetical protein QZH41_010801, partial [Actinostola sp. cb2023]